MDPSHYKGGEKLNLSNAQINAYNCPQKNQNQTTITLAWQRLVTVGYTDLWNQRHFGVLWSELLECLPLSRAQMIDCPLS